MEQQLKQPKETRIGFITRIAYGSGDVACNIVYGMLSTLLVLFYTDYAGISAVTVGTVMLISRLFDGVSDVVMGYVVSKTKSRYGQSRPWIIRMAFPFAISAVLLFAVPQTTSTLQFLYMFVTYNLCTTICYTALNLPYGSLSTMMTRDSKERETLSVFRMAMSPVGRIIAVTCTLPVVKLFGDDQAAWIKTMSIWAVLAVALLIFCFLRCKEKVHIPAREKQGEIPLKSNIKALVTNQYFWMVLVLWALQGTSFTVTGTLLPYYCRYIYLNDTWMYSALYLAETVTIIVCIMLCPLLRRFMSKSKSIILGAAIVLLSQFLFMGNPESFQLCLLTVIIRGIGQAPLNAFIFSMIGDAVEFGQWKTHIRQESFVFSGGSVGAKVGMGASQAIITAIMSACGYISSTGNSIVQPQTALDAIKNSYIWGTIIVWLLVFVVCLFYKLDKKYPTIIKELEAREAKGEM